MADAINPTELKDLIATISSSQKEFPRKSSSHPSPSRKSFSIPAHLDVVCGDGERTTHLTKLAGAMISRHYPIEKVIELASTWNSRNNPPLDDEKIEETCDGIWSTHQNNHPGDADCGNLGPLFDPETARVTTFLSTDAPRRRYLLSEFIPAGIVGAVVARGGSSKTQFLLQLGVSIACGTALCGHWGIGQSGKVLMLLAEDDEEEIHRRLQVIAAQLALIGNHGALKDVNDNLYIRSMIGENNLMTNTAGSGEVEGTNYGKQLIETIRLIGNVQLIVIDPVSRFRGGEENSNEDATRFIESLEFVRKATGATLLVAHHANKGSFSADEASQQAARGASAFTDGLRWQMNLSSPSKNEMKEFQIPLASKHEYVIASVTKSNYTPPLAPVVLRRGEGGYLAVHISATIRSNKEERDLATVIAFIEKLDKPSTSRNFEDTYGGENGPLQIGKNRVRELILVATKRGYLSGTSRKPITATVQGAVFAKTISERIPDDAIPPRAQPSSRIRINKSRS